MPRRHLWEGERALLEKMVRGTSFEGQILHNIDDLLVEEMNDGGMGSLRFDSDQLGKRLFGRQLSEATFVDEDGVVVSATLNLDQDGQLFELDLWKVDNSRLHRYPVPGDVNVRRVER
jgi:hypothetical protein